MSCWKAWKRGTNMTPHKLDSAILKNILKYFKPYKKILFAGYVIAFLATLLNLILPLYIQNVADNIAKLNIRKGSIILGIIICGLLLESMSTYIFSKIGQKVVHDIRDIAWNKVLTLKVKDHDSTKSGELSSRIINDSVILINFVSVEIPSLISGGITIVGAISIMFTLDIVMTGAFLGLAPLIIFTVIPISNKIYEISENQQLVYAEANGYFTEIISQIRMIKAYSGEKFERQRGKEKITELYNYGLKNAKIQAVLSPLMGAIIMVLLLAIAGIGLYRVNTDIISSGVLVAFALYFFEATQPIQTIGSFLIEVQAIKGATKELVYLLEAETEEFSDLEIQMKSEDIVFDNVNFGYHSEDPVLKDVSFRAEKGRKTAIVGESGSGKTTIFSLLERFYLPDSGRIMIGTCNVNDAPITSWRKQFGYVSQNNSLISGTIRENLLYGVTRDVKESELIQVAKMADIYTFIEALPEKFETEVGERGEFLSGGEKQRIAIARALLQDAPYLLLDEATANLDSESETQVQNALDRLLEGRTALIIAHRLSTVMNADKIIVLENGKISGVGTHEQLFKNNPFYKKLVIQQFPATKVEVWNRGEWYENVSNI